MNNDLTQGKPTSEHQKIHDYKALCVRKHPAHMPLVNLGNRTNIVSLTICTHGRKQILAQEDVHQLLLKAWSSGKHWSVGNYVIMPDHIHLFCAPATHPYKPLRNWVKYWKTFVSRQWPRLEEHPIWQIDFWDTQMRSGDNYHDKWLYIQQNPVRAGIVKAPEEWPYQGELNVLRW